MATEERDQQFERALARHLRNSSPDSACPDPETLAACHERTLPLDEMARWKEHIMSCARCQQTLALVEQSEHVPAEEWEDQNVPVETEQAAAPMNVRTAADGPFQEEAPLPAAKPVQNVTPIVKARARRPLRWAVPLGALAAAVIVWVGIHEHSLQRSRVDDSVEVAQNQRAPQAPAAVPQSTTQTNTEEPQEKALNEEARAKRVPPPYHTSPEHSRDQLAANKPSGAANELDYKQDKNQKDIGGIVAGGKIATLKPTSPQTRESAQNSWAASTQITPGVAGGNAGTGAQDGEKQEQKKKAPSRTDQFAAGEPQPPAPKRSEAVNVEAPQQPPEQPQSAAAETVEVQSEASKVVSGFALRKGAFLQTATRDRRYIVTPDEHQAWRVGDQGAILRTTNFGKSWKAQNSGVTVDLISGSAPSRDVCWLIGKAGTVLLTTDGGKHWKQVSAPALGDLGSIIATDALHASVRDTAGRKSFTTTDGGETWTPANP
jgi:hypothetical protein